MVLRGNPVTFLGSILALKILTGTNMRKNLKNIDNKSIKNQRKTASSTYPPRSLSEFVGCKNLEFMRHSNKFV